MSPPPAKSKKRQAPRLDEVDAVIEEFTTAPLTVTFEFTRVLHITTTAKNQIHAEKLLQVHLDELNEYIPDNQPKWTGGILTVKVS